MNKFHLAVRIGLGAHGVFHIVEFALNIAEGATTSAIFTLFSGLLMLAGGFIDHQHHRNDTCKD